MLYTSNPLLHLREQLFQFYDHIMISCNCNIQLWLCMEEIISTDGFQTLSQLVLRIDQLQSGLKTQRLQLQLEEGVYVLRQMLYTEIYLRVSCIVSIHIYILKNGDNSIKPVIDLQTAHIISGTTLQAQSLTEIMHVTSLVTFQSPDQCLWFLRSSEKANPLEEQISVLGIVEASHSSLQYQQFRLCSRQPNESYTAQDMTT